MAEILIVDDDIQFCGMLAMQVTQAWHSTSIAHTLSEGVEKAQLHAFDIVFLDVNLPDGSGLDSVSLFQEGLAAPDIIIITGIGDPDGAELAIRSGVWDYIEKGSSLNSIKLSLTRALEYRKHRQAMTSPVMMKTEGMIGDSPEFKACLEVLAKSAISDASVLITGETGTGKELFASAIHDNSSRGKNRFVVVDCTALPETLVESTLFGHEKGAFTGADQASEGLIHQADGSTLFLDEVGELSLKMQKAFLRIIQEHCFRSVGGKSEIRSDFRLISATNRNLDLMVADGSFREDLLYRLRSLEVTLPPLRKRTKDIMALALHYVEKFSEAQGAEIKGFSPDLFEALIAYGWPGNIRELVKALESAIATAGSEPILYARHLPTSIRVHLARASVKREPEQQKINDGGFALPETLPSMKNWLTEIRDKAEKSYLEKLLSTTGADFESAARISSLARSRLYELLKKHNMTPPTKVENGPSEVIYRR